MIIDGRQINLGSALKRLLEQRDLSLHKVSIDAKINKSSLHNYLNGVMPQGLVSLIKLSQFFNLGLDELVFGSSETETNTEESDLKVLTVKKDEAYEITIKIIKE